MENDCRRCGGSGKYLSAICNLCKGNGKVRYHKCLSCGKKIVMNHIFDKICSNCKVRLHDSRESYKVIFGR
jgi:RecJ-like exonuclease